MDQVQDHGIKHIFHLGVQHEAFLDKIFSSAFTDAQTALATGLATLAAKASLMRMQNEAKAKALARSQVDRTV